MKLYGGLLQYFKKKKNGCLHHTVITCLECRTWYELRWKTGITDMLCKAEFVVVCAKCGKRVYSKGFVCGTTCEDLSYYEKGKGVS